MAPSYDLERIQRLVSRGKYRITQSALRGAFALGFDDEDIFECVVHVVKRAHFYKTMPANKMPGLMQDVYRLAYCGRMVYLKLQVSRRGPAVVISFKQDTGA